MRRRVRRLAIDYKSPVPEWARSLKNKMLRPEMTDPRALEQPADYSESSKPLQAFLRRRAREASAIQGKTIPEWAQKMERNK